MHEQHRIAFGPIPSRRLGRSLGVNTIPAKSCSYDCRYCQVGPTLDSTLEPREFFTVAQVRDAVARQLRLLRGRGTGADYLTFVPDGEPTLDIRLGECIEVLREFDIPIAVISNATLLVRADVRQRLAKADLVSVKVDSALEFPWRAVNRPHPSLRLADVLDGIRTFAADYGGTLISETMLVGGLNDTEASLEATAAFLAEIGPRSAYLATPTRPPAIPGTHGPDSAGLARAHRTFGRQLPDVGVLNGAEPEPFATTGDAREDLLATTAVHAMRAGAVQEVLDADEADWAVVERLLSEGLLQTAVHEGERFYLRSTAVAALIKEHGTTFAEEAGIVLDGSPDSVFGLLCLALLLSAPIRAESAVRAAAALQTAGWDSPQAMAAATWAQRTAVLNTSGYAHYDEKTSRFLGQTAALVLSRYDGDLRRLRSEAGHEPATERRLLQQFPGVGAVGAGIFAREVQAVWTEQYPFADERALRSAARLGLPDDPTPLASLAAGPGQFVRLVAALERSASSAARQRMQRRA